MEASLQQIHDVVSRANLSAEIKRRLLWALEQLPPLYQGLQRTYESRFRDGILGYVEGMVKTLRAQPADCPDAGPIMETIVEQLQAMHERLAIPGLNLKRPAPAKPTRKRKAE
jgi:hypothetical protein